MILNHSNYFSPEMMTRYLSVSQYKDFVGTMGKAGCEDRALAKMRGHWQDEITQAMLVGSYVDAHFANELDVFKAQNPAIFRQDGYLKKVFTQANDIIQRIEMDDFFMKFMSGEAQRIFTGEIFGVPWKCKVDSLTPVCITDLKIMKSLTDAHFVKDLGYVTFVEYWGYDIQAAIYQRLVEINIDERRPFYIAAASKEKHPDIEIIGFNQKDHDQALDRVRPNIKRIIELKEGKAEPVRCGVCDYCRHTKELTEAVYFRELIHKF